MGAQTQCSPLLQSAPWEPLPSVESALLDIILKLTFIPVACAPFLPNFFLPVIFAFDVLWYSTLSRATTFQKWPSMTYPPLWAGVNKCILDHCQVGGLPHYCGFKEQAAHIMAIRTYFTRWLIHTTSFVQIHKMCTNDLHITLPLNLLITGV